MKYSWRSHDWRIGDRCIVHPYKSLKAKATVVGLPSSARERETLIVSYDTSPSLGRENAYNVHRAECIPLKKKQKKKKSGWLNRLIEEKNLDPKSVTYSISDPYLYDQTKFEFSLELKAVRKCWEF